jgi:DNA replication and repair protein RecF
VWLSQLGLESFRNISTAAIDLCPGFNFFAGPNGAGKTAILEAVAVLARGRSFRTQSIGELVQRDRSRLRVGGTLNDELLGTQRVVLTRGRSDGTELRINGQSGQRMSQAAAMLPLEVMDPLMVELVFGGPVWRRRWLDWGLFHVKHNYLPLIRRYAAALKQRNACLKAVAAGRQPRTALEPWTDELGVLGEEVASLRHDYVESLRAPLQRCIGALSSELTITVEYRKGWPDDTPLVNFLSAAFAREVKSGATAGGPHRAELELRHEGMLCSTKLSRGQAKLVASALLLAQADIVQELAHRTSLFLIDDIGAELDGQHRDRLFAALVERGTQVLATAVDEPGATIRGQCPVYRLFHVKHGTVAPA